MTSPRILIIEHEDGAGPAFLGERLEANGLFLQIVRPYLGNQLPRTLDGYAGLIVLGGTPGPADDTVAHWLPKTRDLIGRALTLKLPLLGVCLGGELLAIVAGGKVSRASGLPELGLHELTLTDNGEKDLLFKGLPATSPAVEWHWEEIVELPPGSASLWSSARFPNQAFRVGEAAWGLQFHIEVLTESIRSWAIDGTPGLAAAGLTADEVIQAVADSEPVLRAVWGEVADRWAQIVATTGFGEPVPD